MCVRALDFCVFILFIQFPLLLELLMLLLHWCYGCCRALFVVAFYLSCSLLFFFVSADCVRTHAHIHANFLVNGFFCIVKRMAEASLNVMTSFMPP